MNNSEMIVKGTKGLSALAFGVFAFIYKSVTALMFILVILMITDFVTGLLAAAGSDKKEDQIHSKRCIAGIKKKVGYIILLLIAILLDYTLMQVANINFLSINNIAYGIFSLAVTIFLMSNEFISIVENLGRMGVPVPQFLVKAFKELKDKSETIAGHAVESKLGEADGK